MPSHRSNVARRRRTNYPSYHHRDRVDVRNATAVMLSRPIPAALWLITNAYGAPGPVDSDGWGVTAVCASASHWTAGWRPGAINGASQHRSPRYWTDRFGEPHPRFTRDLLLRSPKCPHAPWPTLSPRHSSATG